MKHTARRIPLAVTAILLACTTPLAPGDVLSGTWANTTSHGYWLQLTASFGGADFSTSCTTAHFPPLRLTDSLTFQAQGRYTVAVGLVAVRVGDPATISGRVLGDRVIVRGDTLTPGSVGRQGCNF